MSSLIEREARRLAQFTTPARISALSNDEFEGYASLFGVADSAGDVVQAGAFATSLARRGPAKVRMLYQHFAHEPIGVFKDATSDAALRTAFFNQALTDYQIVIPSFGTVQGPFKLTALAYDGPYDGELKLSMTLASAGALSFTSE